MKLILFLWITLLIFTYSDKNNRLLFIKDIKTLFHLTIKKY